MSGHDRWGDPPSARQVKRQLRLMNEWRECGGGTRRGPAWELIEDALRRYLRVREIVEARQAGKGETKPLS